MLRKTNGKNVKKQKYISLHFSISLIFLVLVFVVVQMNF
jgi:hypothetical protein